MIDRLTSSSTDMSSHSPSFTAETANQDLWESRYDIFDWSFYYPADESDSFWLASLTDEIDLQCMEWYCWIGGLGGLGDECFLKVEEGEVVLRGKCKCCCDGYGMVKMCGQGSGEWERTNVRLISSVYTVYCLDSRKESGWWVAENVGCLGFWVYWVWYIDKDVWW